MAGNSSICFCVCYCKPNTCINFINMCKGIITYYTLVAVWHLEDSQ